MWGLFDLNFQDLRPHIDVFRSFCCRRELLCNPGLKFQSSNPRAARQKVTL